MNVCVDLRLPPPVSGDHKPEDLIAFATYCAARIARDLFGIERWDVLVHGRLDGRSDALVRAHIGASPIEARASASDPASAIWNAMCHVEQPLRHAAA